MASSSKQLQATTLFLVAALTILLVCATRGHAARPVPGSNDHMPQGTVSATPSGHESSSSGLVGMEMHEAEPEAMRECQGGEEECLVRRTLVAHTDYIYTQGKHN